MMQEALAHQSSWKEELVKTLTEQVRREIAMQDLSNIDASMRSILDDVTLLNTTNDLSEASKTATIHAIHHAVNDIVNKFDHEHSIFKRIPLLAIPILTSLASLVPVTNGIEDIIVPEVARDSLTACKLQYALHRYKELAAFQRISKVTNIGKDDTIEYQAQRLRMFNGLADVMRSTFDTTNEFYACDRYSGHGAPAVRNVDHIYFKDEMSNDSAYQGSLECVRDLMIYLKYRVDKVFDDSLEVLSQSCSPEKRAQTLTPSGKCII